MRSSGQACNIDPRAKMAMWLSLVVTSFLLPEGRYGLLYALLLTSLVAYIPGCLRATLNVFLRLVLPTMLMLFLIYGFLVPHSADDGLSIGYWNRTLIGLSKSTFFGARIGVVCVATIAISKTTRQMQFVVALQSVRIPPTLIAAIMSSLNMYTFTKRKIIQIIDAQKSRGLFCSGVVMGRMRAYMPILRPLVFGMILGAIERSALWRTRGYLALLDQSALSLGRLDVLFIVFALILPLCAGIVRYLT